MSSTYLRLMKDKEFSILFDEEYNALLLSEIVYVLREQDHKSVKNPAKNYDLAVSLIQSLRSGKQKDVKLSNFISLSESLGYEIILRNKNNNEITLHKPNES